MGRWGDGIYDSDTASDYFYDIEKYLGRRLVYLFAPEALLSDIKWLQDVLTVLEIMFILDQNGSIVAPLYLQFGVKRWEEQFFKTWDSTFSDDSHSAKHIPYRTPSYRKEYRHIAEQWFARLTELEEFVTDHDNYSKFVPQVSLPYFSAILYQLDTGHEDVETGVFFHQFIDYLTREIVFVLSEEYRKQVFAIFDIEPAIVAVDIIGVLCEKYGIAPNITKNTVEKWLEKTTGLLQKTWFEDIADDPLYQNVLVAFNRLKAVAADNDDWLAI